MIGHLELFKHCICIWSSIFKGAKYGKKLEDRHLIIISLSLYCAIYIQDKFTVTVEYKKEVIYEFSSNICSGLRHLDMVEFIICNLFTYY